MKTKVFFAALVAATALFTAACSEDDGVVATSRITFSDTNPKLDSNSYWNGSDLRGKFTSLRATFSNSYDTAYHSWSGFAYSNQNDIDSAGYGNQYSVYTATTNTNGTFAVCNASNYNGAPTITFSTPVALKNADFALNTYAYKSMENGDSFAKKFEAGDWYKITITAYQDSVKLKDLDVYLADFRNGANLTDNWKNINLSSFGKAVNKLTFEASSSDVGQFGMNTPAYFCIDNIEYDVVE